MKNYIELVNKVNQAINEFNRYLAKGKQIEPLKETELANKKYFTNLVATSWDDQRWPNSEKSGVYFLMGYDKNNPDKLGLYVGKASLTSAIGYRVYSHLTNYRNKEHYLMSDGIGSDFVLELMSSVTFEGLDMVFMTPALEEFLIGELKESIHLINRTGN
jgi:hypothetical protein